MTRTAEKTDILKIAAAEKEIFSQPLSEGDVAGFLCNPLFTVMIAENKHRFAGYAVFYTLCGQSELITFAVLPEFRRQKIGEELMAEIITRCKALSVKKILLEVRESNLPAIRLYEKKGFAQIAIRQNFYEKPPENGLTMYKEL